jgi:HEAT repeat protein
VPALQRAYSGADVETRLAIVEAAEQIHGGAASGLLMTALKDPDPRIRKKAAEGLGDSD